MREAAGPVVIGVIPARLASERLPGKVLRELGGKAMLHHVYDAARACPLLHHLLVATDSEAVREYCEARRIPVAMTSSVHRSGTERIREVMRRFPADIVINLQADEPLLTAKHVELLAAPFLQHQDVLVSTLKTPLKEDDAENPNVVKVVTDRRGYALYFSRAAIPYPRKRLDGQMFYKHLGLYGYRGGTLHDYTELPPSPLEVAEGLEQLRFLENGIPIFVAATELDTIGVDTEEDWEAVSRVLAERERRGEGPVGSKGVI